MPGSLSSELPVTIRAPEDLLAAIDRFREQLADKPTRPEAIRRLLNRALAAVIHEQN